MLTPALGREENPVDHPFTVRPDLVDISIQVAGSQEAVPANIRHRRDDGCKVEIVEIVEEFPDRPPP